MDYTTCAVPFAFLVGFLLGIGFAAWCLCEKPRKRNSWDAPESTTNGLHVMEEVKAVVEPQPLVRYERECVQVFIDLERKGRMW